MLVVIFEQFAVKQVAVVRVESEDRFVQQQDRRAACHSGHKLQNGAEARGELVVFLQNIQLELSAKLVGVVAVKLRVKRFQSRKDFADFHAFGEIVRFRHAENLTERGVVFRHRFAIQQNFTLCGEESARNQIHQRRFACAVASQQAVDARSLEPEIDPVERRFAAKPLCYIFHFKYHFRTLSLSWIKPHPA